MASKTRTRGTTRTRTRTVYRSSRRRRYYRRRGSGGMNMTNLMPAFLGAGAAHMLGGSEYFQGQNMMINAIALMDVIPGASKMVPWQVRKAAKGYAAYRLFRAYQHMKWGSYGTDSAGWTSYNSARGSLLSTPLV